MTTPIVAIVGRTNVGKSTLLNRLAGKRIAVVADLPGTTRDRVVAPVSWQEHDLTVVDTGGWQIKPESVLERKVKQQVETAIAQADIIIFMVDAKSGVIAADEEIADILRSVNKPTILAVNKVDCARQANQVADFHYLSMGKPIAISAYHNRGIYELMDALLACLPAPSSSVAEMEGARLAIVGRPNVGKSTLLNALLGDERAIVHESPGTTRDSLDAIISWDDKEVLLIDTAGIKRRGKVDAGVDYYSLLRALQAINRCDVALLVVDAAEFITAQDMHIAGYVTEVGKGLILVVNKWDLVPQAQREVFKQSLMQRLCFISYAPIITISAKLGQRTDKIIPEAWQVWRERQRLLPPSEVDAAIKQAVIDHPPPRSGSRQLRISRAYQDEFRPATFILKVNNPQLVHFSYQRYLTNQMRRKFGFHGVPLQLVFTKSTRKGYNRKFGAVKT